jgi:hypothetical protein
MPMKKTTAEPKNGVKRSRRKAKANRKPRSDRSTVSRLRAELQDLKRENKTLKKGLAALTFKDDPRNMDLTPEDGVTEPSLIDIIAQLGRAGK